MNIDLFNPNYDKFFTIFMVTFKQLIEITTSGFFNPTTLNIRSFRPNGFSSDYTKMGLILDAVILTLSLYFLYLIVKLTLKDEQTGKRNWWYILTFRGLLDTLILIFSCISVGSSYELVLNEDDLFDTDLFIDSQKYCDFYENSIIFCAYTLLLCTIRLVFAFNPILSVHKY